METDHVFVKRFILIFKSTDLLSSIGKSYFFKYICRTINCYSGPKVGLWKSFDWNTRGRIILRLARLCFGVPKIAKHLLWCMCPSVSQVCSQFTDCILMELRWHWPTQRILGLGGYVMVDPRPFTRHFLYKTCPSKKTFLFSKKTYMDTLAPTVNKGTSGKFTSIWTKMILRTDSVFYQ